jgi:hypothetical protein
MATVSATKPPLPAAPQPAHHPSRPQNTRTPTHAHTLHCDSTILGKVDSSTLYFRRRPLTMSSGGLPPRRALSVGPAARPPGPPSMGAAITGAATGGAPGTAPARGRAALAPSGPLHVVSVPPQPTVVEDANLQLRGRIRALAAQLEAVKVGRQWRRVGGWSIRWAGRRGRWWRLTLCC